MGNNYAVVGDWISLKAGEPLPMEVLIGESPGGIFCALLAVEVEGEEYPRNPYKGGPTLPIFKTAEPSLDLADAIHIALDPGDASVTNGPVFRDYVLPKATPEAAAAAAAEPVSVPEAAAEPVDRIRTWTTASGETLSAEYVAKIGNQVMFRTDRGKQRKLPLSELCADDRAFIELENPPEFDLTFSKSSVQIRPPDATPWLTQPPRPMQIFDYTFGIKMKPVGSCEYDHELTIEYFAVGEEVDGDNYILLDYGISTFTPDSRNKGLFAFHGDKTRVVSSAIRAEAPMRGEKYGGYLIVITDERGQIIQHKTSGAWLFEHLDNLRKLPVGKHFNRQCIRVGPPRPTEADRPSWTFR
jgi:hypothetical protein